MITAFVVLGIMLVLAYGVISLCELSAQEPIDAFAWPMRLIRYYTDTDSSPSGQLVRVLKEDMKTASLERTAYGDYIQEYKSLKVEYGIIGIDTCISAATYIDDKREPVFSDAQKERLCKALAKQLKANPRMLTRDINALRILAEEPKVVEYEIDSRLQIEKAGV